MRYLSTNAIFIVLLLNSPGCRTVATGEDARYQVNEMVAVPAPVLVPFDSSHVYYTGLTMMKPVSDIYKSRNGHPIWVSDTGKTSLADSMLVFIRSADYYGLTPSNYHLAQLNNALEKHCLTDLAIIDMWLTDSFFAVASDLESGKGRPNDSIDTNLLTRVMTYGDVRGILETKEPNHTGYTALKEELRATLDLLSDNFQADSSSLFRKIESIKINLDRWRNESISFAGRYVYINLPSFMLHVVENDSVVFSSKVIVGATQSPTPEITSLIECFTIYPYWHVPRKISVEEYLPVIQKDTTFLSRNNFDVLDRKGKVLNPDSINWPKFHKNYFPVTLRQREGEENALGIIKFLFDNPYAIYLHDTNAKKLFKSTRRAFSHGCIRMERAIDLAHFLVTGNLNKRASLVEKSLSQKQRNTVNLNIPIPVYIRYYTAEVVNGEFLQYDDLYGRDLMNDESLKKVKMDSQK